MNEDFKRQLEVEKQIMKRYAQTTWQMVRVEFWVWMLEFGQRRLERLKENLEK